MIDSYSAQLLAPLPFEPNVQEPGFDPIRSLRLKQESPSCFETAIHLPALEIQEKAELPTLVWGLGGWSIIR